MEHYTKQKALSIITDCASKYRQNLANHNLLFILQDNKQNISFLQVCFHPYNFLHLTGIKLTKRMSANDFYNKCLNKKLSPDDFNFAKDGTTQLKLKVLPFLVTKNVSASMAGDYHNTHPVLYTEKLIGGINACIGFIKTRHNSYVPNTILNIDIRNITNPTLQIIATYRKKISEPSFNELVYTSKNVKWDKITFPSEYSYLPKP